MFSGFFKRLMMARQLTLEDGHIEEFGVRMAFFPTFTLINLLEKMYEKEGEDAFDLFFETGKEHGQYIIDTVGSEHNIAKSRFAEEMLESANVLGIGKVEAEEISINKGKMVIRLTDSPFAEGCRESDILSGLDRPVDGLFRGMCHSICEGIFDSPVTATETHCEFQGDQFCRFVIKTVDE